MLKIIWRKEYNTNVREIDEQHQHLVHLINVLLAENETKKNPEVVKKVLIELIDYTKYHFSTEEEHMQKHDYLNYDEHVQFHKSLIDQIIKLLNELKTGKRLETKDLLDILKNWLITHIEKEDQKYSHFLGMATKVV